MRATKKAIRKQQAECAARYARHIGRMHGNTVTRLPSTFARLAWSNLAAQSAEQIALAATPIVAVVAFGAGAGETGILQTAQTLPFVLFAIPAVLAPDPLSRRSVLASVLARRLVCLIPLPPLAAFRR